jgi:hypothetical protein
MNDVRFVVIDPRHSVCELHGKSLSGGAAY